MSVFPILLLGLTLWMVNASPTPKLTAESPDSDSASSTREAKQILLPMHFPGQFADFHDYVVPSIQSPGYAFYNDKVPRNPYQNGVPLNVYPQHYGYYPYNLIPAGPNGRLGFALLGSILQAIQSAFGGSTTSSSSSSTTSSSSSSSSTTPSSSSSSSTTSSSSSSATTSSSSSATTSSSSSATTSSSSSATTSSSSSATTSSSSSATTSSSSSSAGTRILITRTATFIPMAVNIVPTPVLLFK